MDDSSDIERMKRNLFLFGTMAVGTMVFLANSGGVAENQQGANRTGELGPGTTCVQCHNGGDFGATTSIEVTHTDSVGAVSAYLPGTEYVLNITVNTSNGSAPVHGMQSTAVDANGNNAGTFSAPSANAQLWDGQDGRHIFEHNQSSSSNTFSATWLAPSGGGDVTFYASGLAANGNFGTVGDEVSLAELVLPEAEPVVTGLDELAWAAPANGNGQTWQWQAPQTGRLVVADVSGRVILAQDLGAGQDVEWDADGLRLVSFVTDEGTRQSWKLAAR